MERLKRLIYLTLFDILVSATTTLCMLYLWDAGKERLAALQMESDLASQKPAVTIVVIGAPVEGTAVMETLGAPTQPVDTIIPPTPTLPSEIYRVRAGDTLGIIADRNNISLQDILAINNLEDPNNLLIGQEILLPTGPLPTLTLTFTPTPTSQPPGTPTPRSTHPPTSTPSLTPKAAEVSITSVLGTGDLATERVRITLHGGSEISLSDWQLIDSDLHSFIFPQLDLFPEASIQVNTRTGLNTAADLFWGLSTPVWEPGETVQLLDAAGTVRATFKIP